MAEQALVSRSVNHELYNRRNEQNHPIQLIFRYILEDTKKQAYWIGSITSPIQSGQTAGIFTGS